MIVFGVFFHFALDLCSFLSTELGEHLHATNTLYYFVIHDKEIADFQEKVRPIEELHPTQVCLIFEGGCNFSYIYPCVPCLYATVLMIITFNVIISIIIAGVRWKVSWYNTGALD